MANLLGFRNFAFMDVFLFIFIPLVVLVGGGWWIGKSIGNALFPDRKETYVDKTTHIHHHYHDNRTINIDKETFKGLKK